MSTNITSNSLWNTRNVNATRNVYASGGTLRP